MGGWHRGGCSWKSREVSGGKPGYDRVLRGLGPHAHRHLERAAGPRPPRRLAPYLRILSANLVDLEGLYLFEKIVENFNGLRFKGFEFGGFFLQLCGF